MKFNKIVLAGIIMALFIASCSKDEDVLDREKFLGTWHVESHGTNSNTQHYNITITGAASQPEQIVISNFDLTGDSTTVYGEVDGNSLLIPGTVIYFSGGQVTVEGTGSYSSGVLTMNYTSNDQVEVDTVSATATK